MIKVKISFETEEEKGIIADILKLENYKLIKPIKEQSANDKSPYNKNYMSLALK